MKASLCFTVSLLTLVFYSRLFEISQAACVGVSCNGSVTLTTTTNTISSVNPPNCNLTIRGTSNENSTITILDPGVVYSVFLSCLNCCTNATTKPEKVLDLRFTKITTSSLSLSWTKPRGNVSKYRINENRSVIHPETSVNITDLTSGEQYTVNVTAVAMDGRTEGTTVSLSTYTKPQMIQNLTVTNVTTRSMSMSWTKPEGHSSFYTVHWTDGNTKMTNNVNNTFIDITNLTAGVQYTITVTAVAADGETKGNGATKSLYTKPDKIKWVNVSAALYTLSFSWDKPDGQVFKYKTMLNHSDGSPKTSEATNAEFSDLAPGTHYTVSVTAIAGDNATEGEPYTFTTVTKPARPVNITAITVWTDLLNISWALPEGRVDYYKVNLNNESKTTCTYSVSFTDLLPGRVYEVTVTAIAGNFTNKSEPALFATVPLPPESVIINKTTNSSLQLYWEVKGQMVGIPNISYNIIYKSEQEQEQSQTSTVNNAMLSPLHSGTLYNIIVKTVGPQNLQSSGANTTACTKPNAVTSLTVTHVNTTAILLTWHKPIDYKHTYIYLVQALQVNDVVYNDSTKTESYTFINLSPGKVYTLSVVTDVAGVQSEKQLTTTQTFPNPPGVINVTSQTEWSINFTWALPEDMLPDQYNFSVTTFRGTNITKYNHFMLENLQSGSLYTINVSVEVEKRKSQISTAEAYTRPYAVNGLRQTEITTNAVTLDWEEMENNYSFLVEVSNNSHVITSELVTIIPHTVTGLLSGTNYSFTVTTQTADGTQATSKTVSYFTRPYNITGLQIGPPNTTFVQLTWIKPQEHKPEYTYLVVTSGCSSPKNQTLKKESVEISDLTPGTNCSFCVSVMAENGIEGASCCRSQYTVPEKVQPRLSSHGFNSSMNVSWEKPPGNVEYYTVYLNSTTTNLASGSLNSSRFNYIFEKLPAGRFYTATVVTQSGPFNISSAPITNATIPNPPGVINIRNKTTSSIGISWEQAPLMSGASFYYRLEIPSVKVETTGQTNFTFESLLSGTPYNISVTTVAAMDFKSETVWYNMVTTKPFNVKSVRASPNENSVSLSWEKPEQYKDSYRYNLTLKTSDGSLERTTTTRELTYTFSPLPPGTSYNFTVTTETSDGTQGAPEQTSKCTNASTVENLKCDSPNEPVATITLSWEKPRGKYSDFMVNMKESPTTRATNSCSLTFDNNLKHYSFYNLEVITQSCGAPSNAKTIECRTGITNPPIPDEYPSMVQSVKMEFNMFTAEIKASLLDSTSGPITNVGVFVTDNPNGIEKSNMQQYLSSTYEQWREKKTPLYLATVTDNVFQSRSASETLTITVGDETRWQGYLNGHLDATRQYQYAVVLFTNLTFSGDLINGQTSLFSVTGFTYTANLPQNPFVIGMAVGVTLGIFCVLLIILIGFIIYWRRLSTKESSDIQIHSMRAKVSVPVTVEDYEAYYKKQKADSNCGFAEEFEDLKVVGTAQSKTNALNPENKPKNRYNNVLPYDSSRVKLSIIQGNPFDDYINANYLPGYNSRKEFIAAQGPLPSTVNDFWRMVWEKNVHTLVMLTRCNEQGRVKCEQYWTLGTKHFRNITVTTTSEIPLEDWTIRDFDIKNVKTAETRSVRHFHFTAWPDHGVPETTELLISFRHLVREHMDQYRHTPTVVHCSAGVGRTGTFIAIDHLIFQIERENIVDIYGIVHYLRMHRPLMVQTEDQYVFLNQCAMDIIRSRTGTNVDLIYQNTAALSIYENIEPRKAYYQNRCNNA